VGSVQNFYTSRDNNTDPATYVGQLDRLWYNPVTNSIFVSDGTTPGGQPVALATGANILANNLTVNTITSTSGNINITGNLVISGNISPAAAGKIGGITPGPGVDVSNQGVLTIDTANLPLSFGDFTANNNILTIVNVNEDMILATQGSAEIQLVGNIGFYKPNGGGVPDPSALFFFAQDDGQIKMFVPNEDPLVGAVEIIGSTTGTSVSPAVGGVMLHVTGQANSASSIYNDGIGSNPNFIGRRYNGSAAMPTQILAGQSIVRFSGQGYSAGGFNPPADGTISLDALENFTQTEQGAIWRFLVNPVGGNVRQEVANISVANGVTATKFTTAGDISATGNITGGNLDLTSGGIIASSGLISTTANVSAGNISVAGNVTANTFVGNLTGTANTATNLTAATGILAGSISINPESVSGTTSSTQTFTLTGLTTSHKLVITSGTALNAGLIIQAAWASALNTISIEFYNTTNQPIDAGATTIQYFAWI
jgi:hypothetical protein